MLCTERTLISMVLSVILTDVFQEWGGRIPQPKNVVCQINDEDRRYK